MTKIDKIYEQEKQEAIQKTKKETYEQAKKEAYEQAKKEAAVSLIKLGHNNDTIVEETGLSLEEIISLRGQ